MTSTALGAETKKEEKINKFIQKRQSRIVRKIHYPVLFCPNYLKWSRERRCSVAFYAAMSS